MVKVCPDENSLALAAAQIFSDAARDAIQRKGRFDVALSGGRTPLATYSLLANGPASGTIPWEHCHIFWGDERAVSKNDPRSNYGAANDILLSRVPIPRHQIHPMFENGDAEKAAGHYDVLLREEFSDCPPKLDLIFLGLGTDGHTASLFPHSTALHEKQKWVVPTKKMGEDFYRITLTLPVLNHARFVLFQVAGTAKKDVLNLALRTLRPREDIPATFVRPVQGQCLWLVDSSLLS